ncbi:DUF4880 domain-containing protein, partial [Pseudomonas aeruginosa]|nr:DUF4880 domain-containing protein [Pseudomonas aeruginosa]
MNDRASRRAPQAGDTELSGPPAAEAIAPQVLRETASWLLLMQEGPLAPAQQAELESWRSRSPEHQRAWRRAERLLANIGSLPPALAPGPEPDMKNYLQILRETLKAMLSKP